MAAKMKTVKVCGRRTNTGSPQSWWVDTGIFVNEGHQLVIAPVNPPPAVRPWGGHAGFGPTGDGATDDWEDALATITGIDTELATTGYDKLWFGSLIGKIGRDGEAFYVGSARTLTANRTGTLFLAFNDGVNFEDNSGYWDVDITFEEEVHLAPVVDHPDGYGADKIYADRVNTSLLDTWGVILTIQRTGFDTPPEFDWDSTAIDNLEAAFTAIHTRLQSQTSYTFKDVFAGVELRFYPTLPDVYGVTWGKNLIRFGQGTRNTVERPNNRGFGRIDVDDSLSAVDYLPADTGFFEPDSIGIQNTVIHELGHILYFRSQDFWPTASAFALPALKGSGTPSPDAPDDVGTFWEQGGSNELEEWLPDHFLNWVRDSYVGVEGGIDDYDAGMDPEPKRASAFWVGGITFSSHTSPGIDGFSSDATSDAGAAADLLQSLGTGESDPTCSF